MDINIIFNIFLGIFVVATIFLIVILYRAINLDSLAKIELKEERLENINKYNTLVAEQIYLFDEINLLKRENIRLKEYIEELKDNGQN